MEKFFGVLFAAVLLALAAFLYSYGLDAPFWKTYSLIGAIWLTVYFLIPAKYRT